MKKVIVLGSGMVGSAMAIDLLSNFQVSVTDIDQKALADLKIAHPNLNTFVLDARDELKLKEALNNYDYVINAVPGFLGYQTLQYIIEAKKDVVDISFMPEDILSLNDLAVANGVTAVVDCGVAPGMGNFILGKHNAEMKINDFLCLVGGLPKVRKWPFEYKAPFSPIDVIEEYTRPARYIENSKIITKTALSDGEFIEFEGLGSLEAFNTDGLRSIMFTMGHIPNIKEKTMRYPGHIDLIRAMQASGFFAEKEIELDGKKIRPIDFTNKILFDEWKLGKEEEELTVMRITLKGEDESGKEKTVQYDLFDRYDKETKTSSMARTTGYTATAALNMLNEGLFDQKGVFPPELIGHDKACFDYVLNYLKDRNVIYTRTDF